MPPKRTKSTGGSRPRRGGANLRSSTGTHDTAENAAEEVQNEDERQNDESIDRMEIDSETPTTTEAAPEPAAASQPLPQNQSQGSTPGPSTGRPGPLPVPSGRLPSTRGKLKFQPKVIGRKSKEERDAEEAREREKAEARDREAASHAQTQGHGPGRFGQQSSRGAHSQSGFRRGDGTFQLRGGFRGGLSGWRNVPVRQVMSTATGAFGGPSSDAGATRGRRTGQNAGFNASDIEVSGIESSPRVKLEQASGEGSSRGGRSGKARGGKAAKSEPLNLQSKHEPEQTVPDERVDVDNIIDLVSDSDEDDDFARAILQPIRPAREEHRDRRRGQNEQTRRVIFDKVKDETTGEQTVTPSLSTMPKRKGRAKGRDVEFVKDERKWSGVFNDEDVDVEIKEEPNDEETVVLDGPSTEEMAAGQGEQLPKMKRESTTGETKAQRTRRQSSSRFGRFTKPVLQTDEDRKEWQRYQDSLHQLTVELGSSNLDQSESSGTEQANAAPDRRHGLVYLFQLPPILPFVQQPLKRPPAAQTKAGQEHSGTQQAPIKVEDGSAVTFEDPAPELISALVSSDETGYVGELNVYEDGQTEFTWGGLPYNLAPGSQGQLLQEVLLTDCPLEDGVKHHSTNAFQPSDPDPESASATMWPDKTTRRAVAIGQIAAGLVATPDWSRLFE